MATTLTVGGSLTGVTGSATPAPVALNSTFCAAAPFAAQTTGSNQLFNFVNNGSVLFVIWNTVASGSSNTWEPVLYPTTAGANNAAVLGAAFALNAIVYTTTATLGAFILGPFAPSKFNDSNGLCWINQVGAGIITSYVGAMTLPGAAV